MPKFASAARVRELGSRAKRGLECKDAQKDEDSTQRTLYTSLSRELGIPSSPLSLLRCDSLSHILRRQKTLSSLFTGDVNAGKHKQYVQSRDGIGTILYPLHIFL